MHLWWTRDRGKRVILTRVSLGFDLILMHLTMVSGKWALVLRRWQSPPRLQCSSARSRFNSTSQITFSAEQARLVKTVKVSYWGAPHAGSDRRFQHPWGWRCPGKQVILGSLSTGSPAGQLYFQSWLDVQSGPHNPAQHQAGECGSLWSGKLKRQPWEAWRLLVLWSCAWNKGTQLWWVEMQGNPKARETETTGLLQSLVHCVLFPFQWRAGCLVTLKVANQVLEYGNNSVCIAASSAASLRIATAETLKSSAIS